MAQRIPKCNAEFKVVNTHFSPVFAFHTKKGGANTTSQPCTWRSCPWAWKLERFLVRDYIFYYSLESL